MFLFFGLGIEPSVDEPEETSLVSLKIEPINVEFSVRLNNLPANNTPKENDFDDSNSDLMISHSILQDDGTETIRCSINVCNV